MIYTIKCLVVTKPEQRIKSDIESGQDWTPGQEGIAI